MNPSLRWQNVLLSSPSIRFVLFLLTLLFLCEYLIYFLVLIQCSWPQLSSDKDHPKPLKIMVLSDTHVLGFRKGHWFDKLRREWQMNRAFQTVMAIHNPEVVFVLGDLFDEGQWADEKEFLYYTRHFYELFETPKSTVLYALAGNHDIGFHYSVTSKKFDLFSKTFSSPSVRPIVIRDNIFILLNSMAFEGDNCSMCKMAINQLNNISAVLKCAYDPECANSAFKLHPKSKPIILQHFPMFRNSDVNCNEPDSAPEIEKKVIFKEKWDCLSESASQQLFRSLDPRIVISGHTHHGCYHIHNNGVPEWTVASFNWRNKNNPNFLLVVTSPFDAAISKCYMPKESTVILIYILGFVFYILWTFYPYLLSKSFYRNSYKYR